MNLSFQDVRAQTRSETLAWFVTQLLHDTRTSRETYAQGVVEAYHTLVPVAARTVEFRTEGDVFGCVKTNTQRLFRMLDSHFEDTRLPVDLEEALVMALPPDYRVPCVRALARRYGLLDVPLPDASAVGSVQSIGQFVASFGETVTHLSPVLADGLINAADAPHIPQAIADLEHLMATVQGLLHSLRAAGSRP